MCWLFGLHILIVATFGLGALLPLLTEPTSGFSGIALLAPFSIVLQKSLPGVLSPFLLLGTLSLANAIIVTPKAHVPRWYMMLFSVTAISILIAIFSSGFPNGGIFYVEITAVAQLLLSLGVVWILRTEKEIRSVLWAFILGGAIASIITIGLYYYPQLGASFGLEPFDLRKKRFNGLGNNPNGMATFYLLSVPFSVWGALSLKGIRQIISVIGLSAGILVILFSQSRSAMIGMGAGLILVPWLIPASLLSVRIRRNMRIGFLLVPMGLALFISRTGQVHAVQDRIQEAGLDQGGRKEAIGATLRIIIDNPMGIGFGAVQSKIDDYGKTSVKTPHNSILSIGAESGWIGFLGAIMLMVLPIFYGARTIRNSNTGPQAIMASACLASMVGFWIHSSFHVVHHLAAFWVAMGISVGIWTRINSVRNRT